MQIWIDEQIEDGDYDITVLHNMGIALGKAKGIYPSNLKVSLVFNADGNLIIKAERIREVR